jgi:hypothetical protein
MLAIVDKALFPELVVRGEVDFTGKDEVRLSASLVSLEIFSGARKSAGLFFEQGESQEAMVLAVLNLFGELRSLSSW